VSQTSWTSTIDDPAELRAAFAGDPDARYRPLPLWWWSGERLDEERLLWQLEQMHQLGCGGVCITGLALHGPAVGSAGDDPEGYTDEWLRLFRVVCERARTLGMKVISWSPFQVGGPLEAYRLVAENPALRAEVLTDEGPVPWGLDYGSEAAVRALIGPDTFAGKYLDAIDDLLGDVVVASFEDEFPLMPRWSPTFADEFRAAKGYDVPVEALASDVGPRTPALRWDIHDVAAGRIEAAYTRHQREWVARHDLLAGFDQMDRTGDPKVSVTAYVDPFRTMAWASAPGTDQMGDARFALSLADIHGAPRVWLEGFHSHGWGHQPALQARLLFEWVREGVNLYLPHGGYYATRAGWWEWAPPEMLWRQPTGRHHRAFAQAVGRLLTVMAAGRHVPEVAVLHPLSTMWAGAEGDGWTTAADEAAETYLDLFGLHGTPSAWVPEAAHRPSLLAEAGYDRVVVDEAHVDLFDVPILVPACRCLRTETVQRLLAAAEGGRRVVLVGPLPDMSAEHGRDDAGFGALVERLLAVAATAPTAAAAVAALPPPRVAGLKSQWRRVGDLDVVFVTGTGRARLAGMAGRRPERWDVSTGSVVAHGALTDGDDLIVDVDGPATILALPPGVAMPPAAAPETIEVALPEVWECEYLPWGENRWGDLRLPANAGSPPVDRRTFAHREGDGDGWQVAPVVPEDVEHPIVDVGFEDRMWGATGRPVPAERTLTDGWHEVVATYGPKAVIDGERLAEYSERLGVEDLVLTSHIGLKGRVEPVKVDLGPGGRGRVVSHGHVPAAVDTQLVIEAGGVVTVELDGDTVAGPVDAGIVAIPVHVTAGWHEVAVSIAGRSVAPSPLDDYMTGPRARVAWAFTEPYRRDPVSIWGAPVVHPDYKGSPGPRRFRRRLSVPQRATVAVTAAASGEVQWNIGTVLESGEHEVVATVAQGLGAPSFRCEIVLTIAPADGTPERSPTTVTIVSDEQWETADGDRADHDWQAAFPVGTASWVNPPFPGAPVPWRSPLLDTGWLEGDAASAGHRADAWADSPSTPPPSWFCFTAAPGARSIHLPIDGAVQAWVDGEPTPVVDDVLALREHARVALRVQPPAGRRGAACFTEHPQLELGPGTIRAGVSWHRQGLDSFAGVIVYRTEVDVALGGDAVLDLDDVAGTVAVRVNGRDAGTRTWAPWRVPVVLDPGVNRIEIEVASTLGPLMARGIPTPFGPEDQRAAGLLARPRLEVVAAHPQPGG